MSEEGTLFLPVRDNCQRRLITCNATDTVAEAAVVMRDHRVSSIIVCSEAGEAMGIMTDRDLRTKVVAGRLDPDRTLVREVMHAPLISVGEDDTLFEALYQMSRHRIHRVAVTDERNHVVGLLNESDVIRLQQRSPQRLLRAADETDSLDELKSVYRDCQELIAYLCQTGVRTRDLVRLIAVLNDHISLRVISILTAQEYADLPDGCAFLALGSEGRREQTLKTDQDNAMIYADDLPQKAVRRIEAFSRALIDGLIAIGVPECPGGIMAKNDFWRRSLAQWKEVVDGWIATPSGDNILNFSMFSDMRAVWGCGSLEQGLRTHVIKRAREDSLFLARMAENVCRFVPPLGFFGGIKTVKQGEHAGQIDLKKAGIFALTEGVKTLALEAGYLGGSTYDKLKFLRSEGVLPDKQVEDLTAAFNLLTFFRIRSQVESLVNGKAPDNFLSPSVLNRVEKARLQTTLEVVRAFEDTLRTHFQLNLLAR